MPHRTCWRRVFASWPVVTTGTCAWMREMHARKEFWGRCSQRKREADTAIEPVLHEPDLVSSGSQVAYVTRKKVKSECHGASGGTSNRGARCCHGGCVAAFRVPPPAPHARHAPGQAAAA